MNAESAESDFQCAEIRNFLLDFLSVQSEPLRIWWNFVSFLTQSVQHISAVNIVKLLIRDLKQDLNVVCRDKSLN